MPEVEKILVSPEKLFAYAQGLLCHSGLNETDAGTVADNLLFAELRGVDTHGIMRLPTYLKRLELGLTSKNEAPKIVMEDETTAVLDGKNGLGPIAAVQAMKLAIKKAREHTVGLTFVRNSQHYGICAQYAMMALEENMIGFSTCNALALMAPTGGKKRVIGNNPFAFAAPTDALGRPFVLDIAMSNVAGGKIMLAEKNGQSIPQGWALDKDGHPTTDAHAGFTGGGLLLPVGGHKGYGMAMMFDILCGVLSGGVWSSHILGTTDFTSQGSMGTCHMMAAINIDRLTSLAEFKASMGEMIGEIKDCPRIDGVDEILIPGEIELRTSARRQAEGIPVSAAVLREVEALGMAAGLGKLS